MNEIFYSLILITIIVVLILVFTLIYYFYDRYNKSNTIINTNFGKTASYVNETNKIFNNSLDNIDNTYKSITNNLSNDINNKTSNLDLKLSSNLNNYKNETDPKITNVTSNLNKIDLGFKQFFDFKNNGVSINDALYNYNFGMPPNLSMTLLRKIDVASGMTINTNDTDKLFRICDQTNSNSCVDLNVNNGNFNIKKSNDGKVLANFNLNSNAIYLGGVGEDAGLLINDNNVYFKNFNLLKTDTNFRDPKTFYDNANPTRSFNTYKYNANDLIKQKLIIGNYSINSNFIDNNSSYQLDVFLKSKYQIPEININPISIEIYELNSVSIRTELINSSGSAYISKMIVEGKTLTPVFNSGGVPPNITAHFRYSGSAINTNNQFPSNNSRAFVIEI